MARRIAITQLNASTIDILNTIRANASQAYVSKVPEITQEHDIPKVGEVLYGYPALANEFISTLVNRIAAVRIKSAVFNNAYSELKKGYLEFGEVVEEVFVNICKAREFSTEKAEARELKRSLPDVRTAFHSINWRVQYPITIQQEDLRQAFTSVNGVQDMIARIIDAVFTGAEYDEFLLFKYLIIKAIAHGKMYPVAFDSTDMKNAAKKFRGYSNKLGFMSDKYNADGVTTTTPKADQYIFMDAEFNADYDVDVLASAFNMDKATFQGKLKLIDDFTTFDNDRFDVIRANSDGLEEVTSDELALCADVKAILVDGEWFQIYDNLTLMTEKQVASGVYWNYFYNVWKTVSSSPFSNAIVFVDDGASIALPDSFDVKVVDKSIGASGTVISLALSEDTAAMYDANAIFTQTEDATEDGIAVHRYGAIIFPANSDGDTMEFTIIGNRYISGTATTAEGTTTYAEYTVTGEEDVGDTIKFYKASLFD